MTALLLGIGLKGILRTIKLTVCVAWDLRHRVLIVFIAS
jgi:hypothetical protein